MIEVAASRNATTLTIAGDLDLSARDQFPRAAAHVNGLRSPLVIIDMCRSTFMDSTGAAFLISVAEAASRRGAGTVLRGCGDDALFVLEICGALDSFRLDHDHRCSN